MSMTRRVHALVLLGATLAIPAGFGRAQDAQDAGDNTVRIVGTVSTRPLMADLALAMGQSKGLQVRGKSALTSPDALDGLAQGNADLALITRPLTGHDKAQYPDLELVAMPVGMEVVALGVSTDLWKAGLHSVSAATMQGIYEQKITNWKQVGGPDEKVMLFNFAQGEGLWEVFAQWLYGDNRKAPVPKVENVASSEDARDDLEFTPGAIVPLAAGLVDGIRCHSLGIEISGSVAQPTAQDVAAGLYPIVRPIVAVTVGRPTLAIRVVTDFLASPEGQALVKKNGALGLEAVPKPPEDTDPY